MESLPQRIKRNNVFLTLEIVSVLLAVGTVAWSSSRRAVLRVLTSAWNEHPQLLAVIMAAIAVIFATSTLLLLRRRRHLADAHVTQPPDGPTVASAQPSEHDRRLWSTFLEVWPHHPSVEWLKRNNFAGFGFEWSILEPLQVFKNEWSDPGHEFDLDVLDEARQRLHEQVSTFLYALGMNTWVVAPGISSVPPEWESEQPKRFTDSVGLIHDGAERVVEAHADLVRVTRKAGLPV